LRKEKGGDGTGSRDITILGIIHRKRETGRGKLSDVGENSRSTVSNIHFSSLSYRVFRRCTDAERGNCNVYGTKRLREEDASWDRRNHIPNMDQPPSGW